MSNNHPKIVLENALFLCQGQSPVDSASPDPDPLVNVLDQGTTLMLDVIVANAI